jgi:hypothetical protein
MQTMALRKFPATFRGIQTVHIASVKGENMAKKIWFYLCVAQAIIILGFVLTMVLPSLTNKKPQSVDLKDYLSQFDEGNNYLPESGYIPDAETAQAVGSAIIDKMMGKGYSPINSTVVEYDEENRLWLIKKGYFPKEYLVCCDDNK